jgi:hypothetical protein
VEVLVEVPSLPLAEDTASLPPLLLVLAVLLAAPPAPVALEVPTPSLPADSSAGSALPQASAKQDGKSARGSRLRVTLGHAQQAACHEVPHENPRAASCGSRVWHSLGQ